ncbi:MAG: hypothetical protein EOM05_02215 [Clostridia bacterium]|nr:hypothetical protein [Clostridia bacterium]
MKRITSIAIVICVFVCALSGCGKSIYFNGKYDSDNFALCSSLKDVRFLIPADYDNMKQPNEDVEKALDDISTDQEKLEYLENHVAYTTNGIDYQLLKPSEFYLYVLDLEGIKSIEDFNDVTTLTETFGIESFIKLENASVNENTSLTVNKCTRVIFSTIITDLTMNIQYLGYISIIEDTTENKTYAIVVGYGDENHDDSAKEIAENFFFAE